MSSICSRDFTSVGIDQQFANEGGPFRTRRRIIEAAIRLYREVGYRKTTVVDIAQATSMSPANVYRFFRSKQAIEEAVVAELLDAVMFEATRVARGRGLAVQRLKAVLQVISELHRRRFAKDEKLHELIAAATRQDWPVIKSHADRILGLLELVIAAGQASGELQSGNSSRLTGCLLAAMDSQLNPQLLKASELRPTLDEIADFCISALRPTTICPVPPA